MRTIKFFIYSLFILFLFSCNTKTEYSLWGTFEGQKKDEYNGKKIEAFLLRDGVATKLDSAIVENNSFVMKGSVLEKDIGYIQYEGLKRPLMFVKEAGEIKIVIGDNGIKRLGTPLNDSYQCFLILSII